MQRGTQRGGRGPPFERACARSGEERLDQKRRSNFWVGVLARNLDRCRDSPLLLSLVPRRGDEGREANLGAACFSPRLFLILRGRLAAEAGLFGPQRVVGLGGVVVAATALAGERFPAAAARFLLRLGLASAGVSLNARQRGDNGCRCHRDRQQNQEGDSHLFFIVRQYQAEGPIPFSAARAAWLEGTDGNETLAGAPLPPEVVRQPENGQDHQHPEQQAEQGPGKRHDYYFRQHRCPRPHRVRKPGRNRYCTVALSFLGSTMSTSKTRLGFSLNSLMHSSQQKCTRMPSCSAQMPAST